MSIREARRRLPREYLTDEYFKKPKPKEDMTQNSFLSDKGPLAQLTPAQKAALLAELQAEAPIGREIDLNKPVIVKTPYMAYPKMLYNHANGHILIVENEPQEKAALKRHFRTDPSPDYDYSRIQNGRAAQKSAVNASERPLTAAELAALDEEEAKA